ncbi:MAG: hypothetical protein HY381_02255 [Candidatus Chisholmbacteria bacterium]|nr:hypothetical protein [Candidatus Chisholmbacteria bacterium]
MSTHKFPLILRFYLDKYNYLKLRSNTMLISTAHQAIKAALQGHWEEAVEHNLTILETDPDDIDALNRLARAYFELRQTKLAKTTYQKVIRLDRYNPIARKNLDKLTFTPKLKNLSSPTPPSQTLFIEEPGKTKTASLVRVTNAKILNSLTPGTPTLLVPKSHTISVTTLDKLYLGALPDDLSHRLIKLIKAGNKYTSTIRTVHKNHISIFLQETFRHHRLRHTPSF